MLGKQDQSKQKNDLNFINTEIIQKQALGLCAVGIQVGPSKYQAIDAQMSSNDNQDMPEKLLESKKSSGSIEQTVNQSKRSSLRIKNHFRSSNGPRVNKANQKRQTSTALIPKIVKVKPSQKQYGKKQDEWTRQKKQDEWTRQKYIKYYCFMSHHAHKYEIKELQIRQKCAQYLAFKNKFSFGAKHSYFKYYFESIHDALRQVKYSNKLKKLQIQTQNKCLLEYLQTIKTQQNSILEGPFQFQHYLQSLNFKPINQVARICFDQIQIQSSSLSYAIITLDSKLNKPDRLIFQDKNQKVYSIYALLNAQFPLQQNQFETIKNQLQFEFQQEFEVQKTQKKEKQIPKPKTKKIKKQQKKNNKNKNVKPHSKSQLPQKQLMPQNYAQTPSLINVEPQIKVEEQIQNGPSLINVEPQIKVEEQIENGPFLFTKEFAQNSENSDQLLDLSIMLGLSPEQIQKVEFFAKSKLSEFRLMRKSTHLNDWKQPEAQQQGKKKCNRRVRNKKTKQYWTEQQMLRLIAFLTLNQTFYTDIGKIQHYLINLMVQFIKTRTLEQAHDKYSKLATKYQSLKQIVKGVFFEYRFTIEQFQAELKRQYERYLTNLSTIILQCEKSFNILLTEPKFKESQFQPLIQERILQSPPKIECITFSNEDQSLKELIQKSIEELKHQFQIYRPFKEQTICCIYDKMKKDGNKLVTFSKFKAICKCLEQNQKNKDSLKTERMRRNKETISKVIKFFSEEKTLKFRILVEFRIIKYDYKKQKESKDQDFVLGQKIILES